MKINQLHKKAINADKMMQNFLMKNQWFETLTSANIFSSIFSLFFSSLISVAAYIFLSSPECKVSLSYKTPFMII